MIGEFLHVSMYTQVEWPGEPKCQPCRLTKKKFQQLGIPFEEIPLDDAGKTYATSLGYTSAPVVEVDYGEGVTVHWSGYRPSMIEEVNATR